MKTLITLLSVLTLMLNCKTDGEYYHEYLQKEINAIDSRNCLFSDVVNFQLNTNNDGIVTATWENPNDSNFKDVFIVYRTDANYPTGTTDGTRWVITMDESNSGYLQGNNSTEYYFTAFARNTSDIVGCGYQKLIQPINTISPSCNPTFTATDVQGTLNIYLTWVKPY